MAQRRDIWNLPADHDTVVFRFAFKRSKRFEKRLQQHETTCDGRVGTWRLESALKRFVKEQPPFCGISDVITEAKDATNGFDDGYEQVFIDVVVNRAKIFQNTAARIKSTLCDFLEAECKARDE